MSQHKPYAPTMAGLGGQPTTTLDDPITAVFLFLFVLGAISHMTILQVNLRRGEKFVMSGMLFGFCISRITACTMRLVWSTHLHNVSIAIAAQIFVAAGVVILFVINIIFAQRILRASHPSFGWARWLSVAFKLYIGSIVVIIIALIIAVVQSFYTKNKNTLRIDRDIQRFGGTYFAVSAFMPIILVSFRFWGPRRPTENFGAGRFNTKIFILLCSSTLLTLGAAFRAGISYMPRPIANPAWYHSKTCFYLFNFTIDWIVVALYVVLRVDRRFIVPNDAHGPGDYSGTHMGEKQTDAGLSKKMSRVLSIRSEEEVFDLKPTEDDLSRINSRATSRAGRRSRAGTMRSKSGGVDLEAQNSHTINGVIDGDFDIEKSEY